ncbi:MAG: ISAs1 family transposase [Dehalococcoidia bacterium]
MASVLSIEQLQEVATAESLLEALAVVPDPRQPRGTRHPFTAILALCVSAMLCGARGQLPIAQWGRDHEGPLTEALGFTRRPPCNATLHHIFKRIDREKREAVLGAYFAKQGLAEGEAIAIDGKSLRRAHGDEVPGVDLIAAYAHHVSRSSWRKRGVGEQRSELLAGKALIAELGVRERVVTADALHCQREVCEAILAKGGDYLIKVKANQPTLLTDIMLTFADPPSPVQRDVQHSRHGNRGEVRTIEVSGALVGFNDWPGMEQVCRIQ